MSDNSDTLQPAEQDTDTEQTSAPAEMASAPVSGDASAERATQGDSPSDADAPSTQPGTGSLTPPIASKSEAKQTDWSQEGPKLQERYENLRAHTNRQVSEWQQRMEQTGQRVSELQKYKQEQEQRAQAASLKPWSKAHPEHGKFGGLLERAKTIEQQLRGIPTVGADGQPIPAGLQDQMRQTILSAIAPEERQQIQEYRDSLQSFQRDFFTDPQGTILPMVEQLAERKVQEVLQRQAMTQSVQRDLSDPQMAPMVEQYKDDFRKALNDGVPYEYAKHMMSMYSELEQMRGQHKTLSGKAALADEQRRLAKGAAANTRDPRAPAHDPYQLAIADAKRLGITPDSPRFAALLGKHSKP